MNRRLLTVGAVMAAVFCGWSCNDAIDLTSDGTISFTSAVRNTKAVSQTLQSVQIASGVEAGVFVHDGQMLIENGANAVLAADGQGAFSATADLYWPEEGGVSVYSYAPYDEAWTLDGQCVFSVEADQSTDAGYLASDLLWGVPVAANPVQRNGDEPVIIGFEHKMSKINVNIRNRAGISLRGSVLTLTGVKTSVTLNLKTGELTGQDMSGDVIAASYADDASVFTASALVAPQIKSGGFVRLVTAENQTYEASLPEDMEFEAGKRYVFTLTLEGDGGAVLAFGSAVDDWEDDDDPSAPVTYGVGDYVLSDGTFMKAAEVASAAADVKSEIAAVIFSLEVSEADAASGYDGYAMSLKVRSGVQWRKPATDLPEGQTDTPVLLAASGVTTVESAINALDGLSFASVVAAATDGGIYEAFDFTGYDHPLPEGSSPWFVPAIGQYVQILNNLAGAGITSASVVRGEGSGEYVAAASDSQVLPNLNAHLTAAGAEVFSEGAVYASSTEKDVKNMWAVKFSGGAYVIASAAGKNSSYSKRTVIPCTAFKFPENK